MEISKDWKKHLLEEIDFAIERMADSSVAQDMLYFFSVVHGTINRILNFEYHPTLLLMWHILNDTHNAFVVRMKSGVQDGDKTIPVTDGMLKRLQKLTKSLRGAVAQDQDGRIYRILEEFAALAYSTTGNGRYLHERQRLVFRDPTAL